MSKKNQLVLAVAPFASSKFEDVFTNLKAEEIDAIKPEWENFMDDILNLNNHEDESKSNSIGHAYDAFRSRFPIGSREGELVILQLLGAFSRELSAKQEEIEKSNPLAILHAILGGDDEDCGNPDCPIHGNGGVELAEGQDAAVLGDA